MVRRGLEAGCDRRVFRAAKRTGASGFVRGTGTRRSGGRPAADEQSAAASVSRRGLGVNTLHVNAPIN